MLEQVSMRRLAIGLALGLALVAAAGLWLQARALRGLEAQLAVRRGVIGLEAVTAVVEELGIDDERVPEAVARLAAEQPSIGPVRVIRFAGIRLLASTDPDDRGDSAAPRRLTREEKPIYDLGQSLRAAVEQNQREGRAWKETIDVQVLPGGAVVLAGPLREEGEVRGAVLVHASPALRPRPPPWGETALTLLLALGVFLLAAAAFRHRPALQVAAATLVFLAAVGAFAWRALGLAQARFAGEEEVASLVVEEAGRAREVLAGVGVPEAALDPWSWDVDRYGQPRGLVSAEGVDRERVEAQLATEKGSFRRLLIAPAVLALLLMGWVGVGGAGRSWAVLVRHRRAYGYVTPALVGMLLLVFFPFFYGITLSFTNSNIYNTDQPITELWVGFTNYREILGDFDLVRETEQGRVFDYSNFYWTLGFTILWTVSNVTIGVTLGLALALMLNVRGLALKPMYRVLLILPWAVPNYITALVWRGMFHSQFGVINHVIQMLGGHSLAWFDRPFTSFLAVLATNGWLSFPFMMVISLGALQSIPADLYEAARVDGATRWQQFRRITLPSLKPALVPAIILSVVWTFNMFNIIYLTSAGEPGGATEILITEAYKIAFEQYRYGYAAAYSVVIFLILMVYGIWQNRITRATEGI